MNQSYIYNNGKVVVLDQYGNQTTVDYCDKLREVLEQENLIEILDSKKWDLVSKQKDYEIEYENLVKDKNKIIILLAFLSISAVVLGLPSLGATILESAVYSLGMLSIVVIGGIKAKWHISKMKKNILEKKEDAEEKLSKLEKQIELQKQYLEDLKKDKTNTREKEAQLTFIDEETNKLSLDENGKVLIKTKRMY